MEVQPIENHGIIGDLHTAALVGMDGSIDFMCFPQFDSPSLFAALLDGGGGGRFQIAPVAAGVFRQKQLYLPDTNMLLTRFLSKDGVAEISDFMPIKHLGHCHDLVRRVKVVRGEVPLRMVCAPRFDYGRAEHQVEKREKEVLFASKGKDRTAVRLRASVPVRIQAGEAVSEFKLRAGQSGCFILEEAVPGEESPSAQADYSSESFKETMNFWQQWVGRSRYSGRWREMVNRAALTLKLLTSQPFGSIVAAPTFGLPEEIGGARNWDYRYTWIRDASFTLCALMFVQYQGAKAVDASSLLMPMVKFISPTDPRWRSHLATVERALVEDSLVYRYDTLAGTQDGLPGREGTFSMCSFWYAECLARGGDLKQARFIFEKALGYANHLGLYSEELGLRGEHLGNFPQAFTHLALISAAFALDRRLSSTEIQGN